MKQKQMKRVCLLIAGILFLLLFFSFSGIEKTKLLDTDGRNFEKAEVTKVISGNLSNSGSGKQTVELKLLSGEWTSPFRPPIFIIFVENIFFIEISFLNCLQYNCTEYNYV